MNDSIVEYALVKGTDPILHNPVAEFDFQNPAMNPVELYNVLATELLKRGGVGLSSNQIGIAARAFVVKSDPVMMMINPMIVNASEETGMFTEGCLSFPGLTGKVRRSKAIRVRYTTPDGVTDTKQFNGLTAEIIQHEMDHLSGITLLDRMGPVARQLALKKQMNAGRFVSRRGHKR